MSDDLWNRVRDRIDTPRLAGGRICYTETDKNKIGSRDVTSKSLQRNTYIVLM